MHGQAQARTAPRVAMLAVGGLLIGAPAGWALGRLIKTGRYTQLTWSDFAALALAAALIAVGLIIGALLASRRGQSILANGNSPGYARPLRKEQVRHFGLQAGVILLAGGMLAAPVLSEIAAHGAASAAGGWVMAGVALAFALQTALNIAVWRASDEVVRRVTAEAGAACFWLLQGALFLWASGEKLGVLPAISSWDMITVLMGAYLVASCLISIRSGLG